MSKQKPRRHEDMLADVEQWDLELANEIGVIAELRKDQVSPGSRLVLKANHHWRGHHPSSKSYLGHQWKS